MGPRGQDNSPIDECHKYTRSMLCFIGVNFSKRYGRPIILNFIVKYPMSICDDVDGRFIQYFLQISALNISLTWSHSLKAGLKNEIGSICLKT